MGIAKVKIENFRTIDRMNLDVKESGISCLLGKNGVGKTTIINAKQSIRLKNPEVTCQEMMR